MLMLPRVISGMVLAGALVILPPAIALAGPGECDPGTDPWCHVEEPDPAKPAKPAGGRGGSGCTWQKQTMPCTDPDFGVWIGGGCYWKPLSTPIDADTPPGKDPDEGRWGVRTCYTAPVGGDARQTYQWMGDGAVGPTPEDLAQEALAKVRLRGARIGVAPNPTGKGAVGLPVWLWTAVTPGTWGPQRASAFAGEVTVSIEAKAHTIVWDMGDGHRVTCANPGTPYEAKYGFAESKACGYRYPRPSITAADPDGRYTITATTHWRVAWSGGGQSGVLTPTSQSQTTVQIGEIQVVKR
jgi:hypothetical protein